MQAILFSLTFNNNIKKNLTVAFQTDRQIDRQTVRRVGKASLRERYDLLMFVF